MSIEQSDSDQVVLLTPVSSVGPQDMAGTETYVPTGQLVVTSQVPIQVATDISANVTNPLINGTNQGANGHPTHHEWVWFWLEGQAGYNLGPAWPECRSIALVVHQELGVMPLRIQQLSYQDVLIEYDLEVDVEWVTQKLLWMEWWMGAPCHLECVLVSDKELWQFRGENWVAPQVDPEWVNPSQHYLITSPVGATWPHSDSYGVPQFLEALQSGQNLTTLWALETPQLAVPSGADPPLPKGESTYNQWAYEVCSLQSHYGKYIYYQVTKGWHAPYGAFSWSCPICQSHLR